MEQKKFSRIVRIDDIDRMEREDVHLIESGNIGILHNGMTIGAVSDNVWSVLSSGNTYTVTWELVDDANTYSCDCPAGAHGRNCKHWKAVAEVANAINDRMGYGE